MVWLAWRVAGEHDLGTGGVGAVAGAVGNAVGYGVTAAGDEAGAEAGPGGSAAEDRVAAGCGGMSFTAGTRVLLASGALVPISRLRAGEKVLAASVRTGKDQVRRVAAVLVHHDADLYDLRVRAGHRAVVVRTTRNHLLWDVTAGRWVKAGALKYGDHLRAPSARTVTATGGWAPRRHGGWMWDLTIPGDHDFYIHAAATAILVHNCGGQPWPNLEPENLGADEADAVRLGVTPAAPGTGAFDKAISSGEIKWAVMRTFPAVRGSLQVGIDAFRNAGIEFSEIRPF